MTRGGKGAWNVTALHGYRRKRRVRSFIKPISVLGVAALGGLIVGLTPHLFHRNSETSSYPEPLGSCQVTDGDTLRCAGERIRLLGIDAPELPGHCRKGRVCTPGDPYASTASLAMVLIGKLTIKRVGEDHYGRTLAQVASDRGDLSCWQIAHKQAIYKPQWDNGLRVARTCPQAVL